MTLARRWVGTKHSRGSALYTREKGKTIKREEKTCGTLLHGYQGSTEFFKKLVFEGIQKVTRDEKKRKSQE